MAKATPCIRCSMPATVKRHVHIYKRHFYFCEGCDRVYSAWEMRYIGDPRAKPMHKILIGDFSPQDAPVTPGADSKTP